MGCVQSLGTTISGDETLWECLGVIVGVSEIYTAYAHKTDRCENQSLLEKLLDLVAKASQRRPDQGYTGGSAPEYSRATISVL